MSDLWSEKYHLKVLGAPGKYRSLLTSLVAEQNLQNKVEFIDYIPGEQLVKLYQNSVALVYPSLLEGFGIPPLEAAACGIPVIVSNIPVFREIYGKFPIYINLGDKSSWKKAFNLLSDKVIIEKLIVAGKIKVNEYKKERMQSELLQGIHNTWHFL